MMMFLKKMVFVLLISFPTVGFFSCSETPATATTESEMVDKEHNSKYVCPMYCEGSGSSEPGECPVCHMQYVENEDYQAPKK